MRDAAEIGEAGQKRRLAEVVLAQDHGPWRMATVAVRESERLGWAETSHVLDREREEIGPGRGPGGGSRRGISCRHRFVRP